MSAESETMSSATQQSVAFIMDSGAFLDIIPTLLKYLDLKSLINLAQTCQFWRKRIYTDLKLWPKIIELPYIGHMDTDFSRGITETAVIGAKVWSMLLPPEDPKALEKVLDKMALSEDSIERFLMVEKVIFKNFIHTDESLRLTALLFPSITEISFEGNLLTMDGVRHIATSCNKLKYIEFYKCDNVDFPSACRLFNTEEHKENLERIFIYFDRPSRKSKKFRSEDDLPFMAPCQRCGLFFNVLKNEKEMSCLYHPGIYSGYGHSCWSYSCCGSMTPSYPSTLGCQYTYHEKCSTSSLSRYELHDGHPEYMFKKFEVNLIPFYFTSRRDLDNTYEKWNIKRSSNTV